MPESERWFEHVLGNVAEVIGGGTPSTAKPSYWGGSIRWITPSEVTRQEGRVVMDTERTITSEGLAACSATLLPENAVLVTSRATVGAVALAGLPMATNQGFAALVARAGVLPRFLMYWVQANRHEFERRASGSTFPEISRSKVKAIPILLPSLVEQRRIVDLIGALDAQIDGVLGVQDALLGMQPAALQSAFQGWPDDSSTDLVRRLDAHAAVIDCEHRTAPRSDELPFGFSVGTGDLKSGDIDLTTTKPADEATWRSWSRRAEIVAGDIIMSREAPVGGVGYVSQRIPLCLGQRTVLVRVVRSDLLSSFLCAFLRSPQVQQWMLERSVGLTVAHLNVADIRAIPLPVFPPMDEQERIGQSFLALLKARRSQEDELAALRLVRQSVLSALLSGDIEIPESYDALLAEAV